LQNHHENLQPNQKIGHIINLSSIVVIVFKLQYNFRKHLSKNQNISNIMGDNMRVLITGTSNGIGKATAELFLQRGHRVFGLDKEKSTIESENYVHHVVDIYEKEKLPEISDIEILINNAGIQTGTEEDIKTNLLGTM
jgi:glutamate dehydrogenase/leucine dehydrogenase